MSKAAREQLHALELEGLITAEDAKKLAHRYGSRRRLPGAATNASEERLFAAQTKVLEAERRALRELRRRREIDNTVLRRIVRSLDVAEEAIVLSDSIKDDEREMD
jgi:hypothetical protein